MMNRNRSLMYAILFAAVAADANAQLFPRRHSRVQSRRGTNVQVNTPRTNTCVGPNCPNPNYTGNAYMGRPSVNRQGAITGVNPQWVAAGGQPIQSVGAQAPVIAPLAAAPVSAVPSPIIQASNPPAPTPSTTHPPASSPAPLTLSAARESLREAEAALAAAREAVAQAEAAAKAQGDAKQVIDRLPIVEIKVVARGNGQTESAVIDLAAAVRSMLGASQGVSE